MQANIKKVGNLVPKTSPKPLQNRSKNHSKIDSKIIETSMPKPLLFRDSKNRVLRIYIYIYMILEQPGLTLEREARLSSEPMYSDDGFAFDLTF